MSPRPREVGAKARIVGARVPDKRKQRPSFWIEDEPPPSSRRPESVVVHDQSSSIEDLRTLLGTDATKGRLDSEILHLANLLNAPSVDAQAPIISVGGPPETRATATAAAEPESLPEICPHCGRDPKAPVDVAPAVEEVPVVAELLPRGTRQLAPWAIAGGSLVVALIAILWNGGNQAPPVAVTLPAPVIVETAPAPVEAKATEARPATTADTAKKKATDAKETKEAKDVSKPEVAAPSAPAGGGTFNRDAAIAALAQAAARASSCKKPGDPSGSVRVTVTFAPSGRATSAQLGGGPYAGTPTGSCIAGQFRSASVPAFEGSPVSASKTVSIR